MIPSKIRPGYAVEWRDDHDRLHYGTVRHIHADDTVSVENRAGLTEIVEAADLRLEGNSLVKPATIPRKPSLVQPIAEVLYCSMCGNVPLTPETASPSQIGRKGGSCRACNRESHKRYRDRQKAEKMARGME